MTDYERIRLIEKLDAQIDSLNMDLVEIREELKDLTVIRDAFSKMVMINQN